MKATDLIILFDSKHGSYAEHYDIVNGEPMNAKPVSKDFFIKMQSNNDTSYYEVPNKIVAISSISFMFITNEKEIDIDFAVKNNTIRRRIIMPPLLFEVNRVEEFVKLYMINNNELYFPYLSNIDANNKICTGTYDRVNLMYDKDYNVAIKEVEKMFFHTRFSNHYKPEIFNNILEVTKDNKNFIPKDYFNEETRYKGYNPLKYRNRPI